MKSLFKNSLYNIIYNLFMLAFPLVSSVYVSRILSPDGIGNVAFAQNIVSYFIPFAGFGVSIYGIKEIGKVQGNKKEYTRTFIELFSISFISSIVCSITFYLWIFAFNPFKNNTLLLAAGCQLILSAFNVDWFFQGMEEYKYITTRSILIKALSLLYIFIIVKSRDDVIKFALLSSVAMAGSNLISFIRIRKYINIKIVVLSRVNLRKYLKPLIVLISTNIAIELYTKLDTTMLGILAHSENIAFYNYASKITAIVVNLAAAMSTVLLPRLSNLYHHNNMKDLIKTVETAYKGILLFAFPAVVGIILIASDAVNLLFGEVFMPAALTTRILSILILIKSIGNLFGTQVLLTFGKEKLLFLSTLFGSTTNVIMNAFLIPIYQENGAAIASVISEFVVCLVQIAVSRKYIRLNISFRQYINVVMPTTCMAIVVLVVQKFTSILYLRISSCCLAGVISYYFVCIILKNETVLEVNKKICDKVKIVFESKLSR